MLSDAEETNWAIYRVSYNHNPDCRGWCIFELQGTTLVFVDGPWVSEKDAKEEMAILNKQQGVKL